MDLKKAQKKAVNDVLSGDSQGCLLQGDCLDLLADLPDGICDAVIIDPPYCSGGRTAAERQQPVLQKYVGRPGTENCSYNRSFGGDSRD